MSSANGPIKRHSTVSRFLCRCQKASPTQWGALLAALKLPRTVVQRGRAYRLMSKPIVKPFINTFCLLLPVEKSNPMTGFWIL